MNKSAVGLAIIMGIAMGVVLIMLSLVSIGQADRLDDMLDRIDRAVANTEVIVNRLETRLDVLEQSLDADNVCVFGAFVESDVFVIAYRDVDPPVGLDMAYLCGRGLVYSWPLPGGAEVANPQAVPATENFN